MSDTVITDHQTRQQLHTTIRKDTPFHEKAREALDLGKQYLDVDRGYLTRVDQETDHWEIVVTSDTEAEQGSHNLGVGLQKTYSPETIEDDVLFALHDASDQGWDDDPAFEISDQNAYLEIPVITEDGPYGTVRFVAQDSRSESFTEAEIQFADHLTRLLERELEKSLLKTNSRTNLTFPRFFTESFGTTFETTSRSFGAIQNACPSSSTTMLLVISSSPTSTT